MTTGEGEPKQSLEEQVLIKLGYGHSLDKPVTGGAPATGRNFLDAYGDSPHRQDTADLLSGFLDMAETDPDYEQTKNYISRFLKPQFGPPQPQ